MLHAISELQRMSIRATDGAIGGIADVYFDDRNWAVRFLIANTGGWLSERLVLISPAAVAGLDWEAREAEVRLTMAQVEASPPIEAALPVSEQKIVELNAFYGWPDYWGGTRPRGGGPWIGPAAEAEPERIGDPHLQSAESVKGYSIRALDDGIGQVDDYLFDAETWFVRYLVVDTRKWLPGKKVLIAPPWIHGVDWAAQGVAVELTRDSIRAAPEYDKSAPLTRQYEDALHRHYQKTGYWIDVGTG
jgi:hypothetical protein